MIHVIIHNKPMAQMKTVCAQAGVEEKFKSEKTTAKCQQFEI